MWAKPSSTLRKRNQVGVILYQVEEIWSRRWDSNPRPADYESAALPLSYTGVRPALYHRTWRLSIIYIHPELRVKTGNAVGNDLEFERLMHHRVEASALLQGELFSGHGENPIPSWLRRFLSQFGYAL